MRCLPGFGGFAVMHQTEVDRRDLKLADLGAGGIVPTNLKSGSTGQ
jgi:hypothetical protein